MVEAVRKAKAEANRSMKAPVERVDVMVRPETRAAVETVRDDVVRMLHIETFAISEGEPEQGLARVETKLAPPEA